MFHVELPIFFEIKKITGKNITGKEIKNLHKFYITYLSFFIENCRNTENFLEKVYFKKIFEVLTSSFRYKISTKQMITI